VLNIRIYEQSEEIKPKQRRKEREKLLISRIWMLTNTAKLFQPRHIFMLQYTKTLLHVFRLFIEVFPLILTVVNGTAADGAENIPASHGVSN
jgi:hypothetical protein